MDNGLHIRPQSDELSGYITKQANLSFELTSSGTKESQYSYTPVELLQLAHEGDSHAESAWLEYSYAIKGVKALQFSDELESTLGIDSADDTAPAESDSTGGILYANIPLDLWRVIRTHKRDIRVEILRIARDESVYRLAVYLSNTLDIPFESCARIYPAPARLDAPESPAPARLDAPAPRPLKMRDVDIIF